MIFKKNKKEPFLRTLDVWIAWSFVTVVLLPFSLQNFHSTKKLNLLTNKQENLAQQATQNVIKRCLLL